MHSWLCNFFHTTPLAWNSFLYAQFPGHPLLSLFLKLRRRYKIKPSEANRKYTWFRDGIVSFAFIPIIITRLPKITLINGRFFKENLLPKEQERYRRGHRLSQWPTFTTLYRESYWEVEEYSQHIHIPQNSPRMQRQRTNTPL